MRKGWLLREGDVLCNAEVTQSFAERTIGLLGKRSYDGAMLFTHTRSVHTFGMRIELDVAFVDRDMTVLAVVKVPRWRIALPRRGGRSVLEAQAGAFERWNLKSGDKLDFREAD